MVRIRLRRVGGKNQPSFRIVAADKESPRDGRFIEILGFYNPRTEPATIQLKEDRIYDWISKGAQPSDSAMQLFKTAGLIERYERFKSGEDVEKLVAEGAAAADAVSPKTRRPAPESAPDNKKAQAKAQAEAAAAAAAAPPEAAEAAPAEEAEAAPAEEIEEAPTEETEAAPAEETEAAPAEEAEEAPAEEAEAAPAEEAEEAPAEEAAEEEPKAEAEESPEEPEAEEDAEE
jgi:small subunit ribosomal protein S16